MFPIIIPIMRKVRQDNDEWNVSHTNGVLLTIAVAGLALAASVLVTKLFYLIDDDFSKCRPAALYCDLTQKIDMGNIHVRSRVIYERNSIKESFTPVRYGVNLDHEDVMTIASTWKPQGHNRFLSPNGRFIFTGEHTIYNVPDTSTLTQTCHTSFCSLPYRFVMHNGVVLEKPAMDYHGNITSMYP